MAKRSTMSERPIGHGMNTGKILEVAGLDVGDKHCHLCVMDGKTGEVVEETRLTTSEAGLRRRFGGVRPMRIAIEAGVHSPWISRLLDELGHEVLVANPRKLRLIYENRKKNDKVDAEYLARLARVDPKLLHPLEHRGEQAQADLAVVRSRDQLVQARSRLVTHVRNVVKSHGHRLPSCDTVAFARRVRELIPEALRPALWSTVDIIAQLSEQIQDLEKRIEELTAKCYPETGLLTAVNGVGSITALAYVLVIEDPDRFAKSRSVGKYVGLTPGLDDSGQLRPQRPITCEGDELLRRLLIQCAHYIMGPFGKECDLRRYGERIACRGGKAAKKRAVVAVARKLAVLLHTLWRNGEIYDPDYNLEREQQRRRRASA